VNDQPFNLAICRAGPCAHDGGLQLLDRLRAVTRHSRYGVLVSTGCLMAADRCQHDAAHDAGTCLLVQPCGLNRRPRGAAIAVGPILTRSDAEAVTAWLENGRLDAGLLDPRLRFTPRSAGEPAPAQPGRWPPHL
jgi:hypothetical protein